MRLGQNWGRTGRSFFGNRPSFPELLKKIENRSFLRSTQLALPPRVVNRWNLTRSQEILMSPRIPVRPQATRTAISALLLSVTLVVAGAKAGDAVPDAWRAVSLPTDREQQIVGVSWPGDVTWRLTQFRLPKPGGLR